MESLPKHTYQGDDMGFHCVRVAATIALAEVMVLARIGVQMYFRRPTHVHMCTFACFSGATFREQT
jgi:hypothetical protein